MKTNEVTTTPPVSQQDKDMDNSLIHKRKQQEKIVFLSLKERPKTMLIVAIETGKRGNNE